MIGEMPKNFRIFAVMFCETHRTSSPGLTSWPRLGRSIT